MDLEAVQFKVKNGVIFLKFKYDAELVTLAKKSGMRWSPEHKIWHTEDTISSREALSKNFPHFDSPEYDLCNFYTTPDYLMQHQKVGVEIARHNPRWGYFWSPGVGKTALSIEIIRMRNVKTLVVCPLSIIEPAWIGDIKKFAPDLKYSNLWKIRKLHPRKMDMALKNSQVCLINYESFRNMTGLLKAARFQMIIADESSKLKNHKSLVTKSFTTFCDDVPYVYLLSGSPAPNSRLEYFSQVRNLNQSLFGKSFFKFRNKYFITDENGFKWFLNMENEDDFLNKLSSVSSVVSKEDVLDLPERVDIERYVELSPKEHKAYNEMAKNMIAEIEDEEISAQNAVVKLMKLRQVTSGFLFNEDKEVVEIGHSKLKELLSLLEELGESQVIIWCTFQYEAKIIHGKLKSSAICNGTVSQEEKEQAVKDFQEGKIQYLVANAKTLGHGVTLVNCNYVIYYSLDYSHESHLQSRDRIYRKGQVNKCTYYYLVCPRSIDTVIIKALERKGSVEKEVFDYIKEHHR